MSDISIVTCTYNPDDTVFERTLRAIQSLNVTNLEAEAIIVDNNSKPALIDRKYVQDFLNNCKWARLIVEPKQGKTYAVIKGVQHTTSPVIVNFDDDNLPEPDYLEKALKLIKTVPEVAIWGPGKISVQFTDKVPEWVYWYTLGIFQEKDVKTQSYSCEIHSPDNPAGTGMVIKKEVLELYIRRFVSGELTNLCRTGDSLVTGGDAQIVLTAIQNNYSCGIDPGLKLGHLIPARRTHIKYIKRILFGFGFSHYATVGEVFPEELVKLKPLSEKDIIRKLANILFLGRGVKFYDLNKLQIDLADNLGHIVGVYKALNMTIPGWLLKIVKTLKLE